MKKILIYAGFGILIAMAFYNRYQDVKWFYDALEPVREAAMGFIIRLF